MNTAQTKRTPRTREPAWEIVDLFPPQGLWSEPDYLGLPTNRLVELADGRVRILPMPTDLHQLIVILLLESLRSFVRPRKLGRVRVAPLPVRLWEDEYREPDVLFMLTEHLHRCDPKSWDGADLLMEVVSADAESRKRDHVEKRAEYARARIPEYWIVDPQRGQIIVLRLRGRKYVVHGTFGQGQVATSVLLKGFTVDVDTLFSGEGD